MKTYYIYILASDKNGTIYIGVTNDLHRRLEQHKSGTTKGFTEKYKVNKLVWYDQTNYIAEAILREKQMKKWKRAWKVELIEKDNPGWKDLGEDFIG